jgi:hypothetical protein
MEQLNRLLTQIRTRRHKAKDTLSEEAYREILQRTAGVASSTQIRTIAKAKAVLAEFDRLQIAPPAGQRRQLTPMQKKLWSCWQQLADAGRINDRSMGGLQGWIKAQYSVDDIQFLTWPQEHNAIERLKRWLARGEDKKETEHG